jgi:serine/threonine protein kinase
MLTSQSVGCMGGAGTVVSKLPDAFKIKWADLELVKNKENRLGRGGFGVVYKGWYLTEPVAIKLVDFGDKELSSENLTMFWNEVQLHYSIRHPNVVTVIGASINTSPEGDIDYAVVLELMKGSLRGWIHEPGAVSMKKKLRILKQLAAGLAFLHARKIVHRDLKPDNALLDASGT